MTSALAEVTTPASAQRRGQEAEDVTSAMAEFVTPASAQRRGREVMTSALAEFETPASAQRRGREVMTSATSAQRRGREAEDVTSALAEEVMTSATSASAQRRGREAEVVTSATEVLDVTSAIEKGNTRFKHKKIMAKLSRSNGKKKNGMNLKTMVQMFQKSFLPAEKRSKSSVDHFDEFENSKDNVANDVKEGHFAVMAVDNDEKLKRFIVPLSCLAHPSFLRLLEKAAEEYGFEHEGALMLPCRPIELERILAKQYNGGADWKCCTSQDLLCSN
nr:auxin-responsive protein SAUR50-like [Ipomoea batatas]